MKCLQSLLLILAVGAVSGFVIRPHIWNIVDEIAEEGELHSSCVGRGCMVSDQWKRYEQLRTEATAEELVDLSDYTNGVVRCYAFMALAERRHPEVYSILLQHLADCDTIYTQSGCIGSAIAVRDFFIETVTRGGFIAYNKRAYRLSSAQKKEVDSLLVLPIVPSR